MRLAGIPDGAALVRATLLAGAVAGLVLGAFHLTVSEPVVDRAITLEQVRHDQELAATGATEEHHEDVFSRRTQEAGLLVGALIYSLAAGAIFAGAFALLAPRLPGSTRRAQVTFLVAAAVVTVVLVPFLKYPANPPGVGDPGTLASRQLLYLACILLGIAGIGVSVQTFGRVRRHASTGVAVATAAVLFTGWVAVLLILLPARTDPVSIPSRLLWEFRLAALAGHLLFWVLFGGLFATLLARGEQASALPNPRVT